MDKKFTGLFVGERGDKAWDAFARPSEIILKYEKYPEGIQFL